VRLTVVTWNMDTWQGRSRVADHQERAWRYLVELGTRVGADVALVQEALPPPPGLAGSVSRTWPPADQPRDWQINPDANRSWGSGIAVMSPRVSLKGKVTVPLADRKRGELAASHPGTFAVADVAISGGGEAIVASVYGLWDDYNPENARTYSEATLHRTLSDLTPIIDSHAGKRMVLGGDLNIFSGYGWKHYGPVIDRLKTFGFIDCLWEAGAERQPLEGCYCGPQPGCRHVQTHRHRHDPTSRPWQTDFIFAAPGVGAPLDCRPVNEEEAWTLSDHCPVIATFDLPAAS